MNVRICACIRNQAHPTQIAVYDPTCTQNHAPPSLYRPDRTHNGLGRLLMWALVVAVCAALFLTPNHAWTGWHWAAAIANTALALRLHYTAKD